MIVYEAKLNRQGVVKTGLYETLKSEIRNYCLLKGFNQKVYKKICSLVNNYILSLKSIYNIITLYESIFNSLGLNLEDFINFINENALIIERNPKEFYLKMQQNIAMFYFFNIPIPKELLSKLGYVFSLRNSEDIYALILCLKNREEKIISARESKNKRIKKHVTFENVYFYLLHVSPKKLEELKDKYPFSARKKILINYNYNKCMRQATKTDKCLVAKLNENI